jgi:DNA (cytosine-5)-methyltransferase 1
VIRWAAACKPRLIHLENVEEFADWGPLLADGTPCKQRKGQTFRRWKRQLERLGYVVEHRELIAADYDTPTIRKRLYVIARCDNEKIVWPKPTNSRDGHILPKWRQAAECIDWSIPGNSIFGRKKPHVANTHRRIAKGIWRHVLTAAEPFIVPLRGTSLSHTSTHALTDPLSTVSGQGTHHALVSPCLTEFANASTQRTFSLRDPMRTQMAQIKGGHFALVAAHITKFRFNSIGSAMTDPMHTVTAGGDMARPAGAAHAMGLVSAHLTHLTHHGDRSGYGLGEPFKTITGAHRGEQALVMAHLEQANSGFYEGGGCSVHMPMSTVTSSGSQQQLVTACLVKYYGQGGQWQTCSDPMHTVPTKDRLGLVQIIQLPANALTDEQLLGARRCAAFLHEHLPEHFPELVDAVLLGHYVMTDITLRMLVPRELARAQGFEDTYIIDRGLFETFPGSGVFEWRKITKTEQVKLIGNSVCRKVARAIVASNAASLVDFYRRAEAA